MQVTVRGKTYESPDEAAKDLGVSKTTVYGAVRKGRTETLGLGTGLPIKVCVRGVVYQSVAEAAKALGVKPSSVNSALSRGNPERLGIGNKGRERPKGSGKPGKPVTIAGRTFSSIAELARAIGRPTRSVRASFRGGKNAQINLALAVMKLIAREEQLEAKRRTQALDALVNHPKNKEQLNDPLLRHRNIRAT